ncbi:head completion protein [Enterobacter cloacae]|nr:head completion protein [Enterobacter cloacae]VAM08203.1 head completion protein [Enterobacter kobei]
MSSLVATKHQFPASSDVSDVDDGNETVTAGNFWPVIQLKELRLSARITGGVTTSRLKHVATEAVAHVTEQLDQWQASQKAAGYAQLQDVPARKLNDESAKVYRYRRAVYSIARALVLEGYRDVDTTPKGDKDAAALDLQISDLWRDARWGISDIQRKPRIYAELC